jgi:Na+-translocating ferredoxin:NAD+ oxidoreductase RnfG subunit
MDNQIIFNFVVCVAGFLGSFVFYQVMQRLQRAEDQIAAMKEAIPKEYVQKGDYKEDMREIKELLRQIFDKLDGKADK